MAPQIIGGSRKNRILAIYFSTLIFQDNLIFFENLIVSSGEVLSSLGSKKWEVFPWSVENEPTSPVLISKGGREAIWFIGGATRDESR